MRLRPGSVSALAIRRGVAAIGREPARERLAVFLKRLDQRSLAEAEPIAIGRDLVKRIDRGDRVLQIHDGGDRRFEDDVGDAGGIVAADRMRAIDDELDVQFVVDEKNGGRCVRAAAKAGKLLGVFQADSLAVSKRRAERAVLDRVAARIGMRTGCERHGLIEKTPRPGNDELAARRIVALRGRCMRVARNSVGAVERIVERAPARVGGIERIARIAHRHHELRPGDGGDLVVDRGGLDLEVRTFRHEVADLGEERFLRGDVGRLPAPPAIPSVDLRLQFVAPLEQGAVARREVMNDAIKPSPECRGVDPGARNDLVRDEIVQDFGNLQISNRYAIESGHEKLPCGGLRGSYRAKRASLCMKCRPQSMGRRDGTNALAIHSNAHGRAEFHASPQAAG